jgi:hypothetical protein
MMRHLAFVLLAGGLGLGVAACDPYSPDLGDHPFRCGTSDPTCPSGYTCSADNVCERSSGDGDVDAGDDGSGFQCNDDSDIEPNESVSDPFLTPIPDFKTCMSMVQLAICPDTDKDLFQFRVDEAGKNMKTVVTTNVAAGQLTLRVLASNGSAIGSGLPLDATHIEVVINNLATGSWFVEVGAPPDVQNNYTLDIFTCDDAGCASATTCI